MLKLLKKYEEQEDREYKKGSLFFNWRSNRLYFKNL